MQQPIIQYQERADPPDIEADIHPFSVFPAQPRRVSHLAALTAFIVAAPTDLPAAGTPEQTAPQMPAAQVRVAPPTPPAVFVPPDIEVVVVENEAAVYPDVARAPQRLHTASFTPPQEIAEVAVLTYPDTAAPPRRPQHESIFTHAQDIAQEVTVYPVAPLRLPVRNVSATGPVYPPFDLVEHETTTYPDVLRLVRPPHVAAFVPPPEVVVVVENETSVYPIAPVRARPVFHDAVFAPAPDVLAIGAAHYPDIAQHVLRRHEAFGFDVGLPLEQEVTVYPDRLPRPRPTMHVAVFTPPPDIVVVVVPRAGMRYSWRWRYGYHTAHDGQS